MKTRKTAAEKTAFDKAIGAAQITRIATDAWRNRLNRLGLPMGHNDAVASALWTIVEQMECEMNRLDTEYKRIAHPRIYGSDPSEFQWSCSCNNPKAHPRK